MELRGFDDYEVTLGDEIRGERASRGKSLEEVERELHIKADLIQAIENCDLGGFPNHSVVAGYVRSYARYLGMNPEEFYARFCAETGFQAPSSAFGVSRGGKAGSGGSGRMLSGSPFDESRFATPPTRTRFDARVSFGSLASAAALVTLCCGLGYGGYALLQNIQKVGFAPLPEAPDVATEAPDLDGAVETAQAGDETPNRPSADVYSGSGALAAVFAPNDLPPVSRRDGPISAIDPVQAGLFRGSLPSVAPRSDEPEPESPIVWQRKPDLAAVPVGAAGEKLAVLSSEPRRRAQVGAAEPAQRRVTEAAAAGAFSLEQGIAIEVDDAAWIRVRDGNRSVVFEGILPPGERFELPDRVENAELRAGNAGAVFVRVDGVRFGPIGAPGSVAKKISLQRVAVMATFPKAPGTDEAVDLSVEARAVVQSD